MKILGKFDKIPTRYDDIQKDILEARLKKYYNQKSPKIKEGTYKLGEVCSNVLGKF